MVKLIKIDQGILNSITEIIYDLMCEICTSTELLYNVKYQRKRLHCHLTADKIGDVPIVHGWIQIWSAEMPFFTNSAKLNFIQKHSFLLNGKNKLFYVKYAQQSCEKNQSYNSVICNSSVIVPYTF